MIKEIFIITLLIYSVSLSSQQTTITSTFTFKEYLQIVKENHPVSFQASLLNELNDANKLRSKGGFDPKTEADYGQKSFDGKNYFRLLNSAIKVPTWFGIDLKASYQRNSGEYLNNENFLPPRGIWSAGISVPLGKGLVIDERRAELQKADLFSKENKQEQRILYNNLIFEASIAYQEWQAAQEVLDITNEGVEMAIGRFQATKNSYINGDKAAIDTLEALISLQTLEQAFIVAKQENSIAINKLENYLWIDGYIPLEIESSAIPEKIVANNNSKVVDSLAITLAGSLDQNPNIIRYDLKLASLEIDKKLNIEDLKPNIRVEYNPLIATGEDAIFNTFNANDYKLGASFSYPLLLRKERGKLAMTKIKFQETEILKKIKKQEIKTYLNECLIYKANLEEQLILLEKTTENYTKMVAAENEKFFIGESSFFLVNAREMKRYEANLKLVNTKLKASINNLKYLYHSGLISEIL
jgi:outer membrane protein TolC